MSAQCDGFTRTGEHNMGAAVMRRCTRPAEYVCTLPDSERYELLCRYHKAAWMRGPYMRKHGICERASTERTRGEA